MRILSGWEAEQSLRWFEQARIEATMSMCGRAKCGTVIVQQHGVERIIGRGFNAPPGHAAENRRCERKHEILPGFKSDKTCCIHAEQAAVLDGCVKGNHSIFKYSRLYFVRLDENDQIKPSGKPYCTICSKMALEVGVSEWALIHKGAGITVYDAKEYNDISFQYNEP